MKKVLPFFLFFLLATPAYASTASVNIENNVNTSSSNSNSNTSSNTHVKIETNGKVMEYNSDEPGDLEVKSVNGESSIKLNGKDVSGSAFESEDDSNNNDDDDNVSTHSATVSPKPTKEPEKENENKKQTIVEKILDTLNEAFAKISSLL